VAFSTRAARRSFWRARVRKRQFITRLTIPMAARISRDRNHQVRHQGGRTSKA